jgi:hypothetical protein
MAAPNQPKAGAAISTPRRRTPAVTGNQDWVTGQAQRQIASHLCGNFGISC